MLAGGTTHGPRGESIRALGPQGGKPGLSSTSSGQSRDGVMSHVHLAKGFVFYTQCSGKLKV